MNGAPDADIALFTEAMRLPPEERGRYLTEACKGDGEFRRRVEALLEAYGRWRNIIFDIVAIEETQGGDI